MTSMVVVGVGNVDCGDDALGPLVVERVRGDLERLGVACASSPCEPTLLMDVLRDASSAVLVDACVGPFRLGSVVTLSADEVVAGRFEDSSTHGFGLSHVLALMRALGVGPERVRIVAIVGKKFGPGDSMSPEARAAMDPAARAVLGEVKHWLAA